MILANSRFRLFRGSLGGGRPSPYAGEKKLGIQMHKDEVKRGKNLPKTRLFQRNF